LCSDIFEDQIIFKTTSSTPREKVNLSSLHISHTSHIPILAMGSQNHQLPAMATNPKFIFFTDFDGTITSSDSNDYMTDNLGYGREKRLIQNKRVLANDITFRDAFHGMLDSVPTPFNECVALLLEKIGLDPGFREFHDWARANNVPIVILSGGMTPLIRALLEKLIGEDSGWMQIVSNEVGVKEGKASINEVDGWEIVFHDDRYVGPRSFLIYAPIYQEAFTFLNSSPIIFPIMSQTLSTPCAITITPHHKIDTNTTQRLRPRQVPRDPPVRRPAQRNQTHHVLRW
jgi:2,3-diketo-5-methylthio-1-phosphopentane phosphatase